MFGFVKLSQLINLCMELHEVHEEVTVMNRKFEVLMKHLHLNMIETAALPADFMIVETTTAEEKHL